MSGALLHAASFIAGCALAVSACTENFDSLFSQGDASGDAAARSDAALPEPNGDDRPRLRDGGLSDGAPVFDDAGDSSDAPAAADDRGADEGSVRFLD
jgi:hypothetical protein